MRRWILLETSEFMLSYLEQREICPVLKPLTETLMLNSHHTKYLAFFNVEKVARNSNPLQ